MPNPKVGTVTMDVAQAVQDAKGGQVQFRVEKAGIVHAGVGKASFDADKLAENVRALVDAVNRAKPTGAKGTYLKKVSLSSTMGPGVCVALDSLGAAAARDGDSAGRPPRRTESRPRAGCYGGETLRPSETAGCRETGVSPAIDGEVARFPCPRGARRSWPVPWTEPEPHRARPRPVQEGEPGGAGVPNLEQESG